jgi:hypothetical protein
LLTGIDGENDVMRKEPSRVNWAVVLMLSVAWAVREIAWLFRVGGHGSAVMAYFAIVLAVIAA